MEHDPIRPEEVSVIVRGLVVGSDQPDERSKFTKRALASVRKHLPGAQIILSTWKGADVSGLEYDNLVVTDPPEMIYILTVTAPGVRPLCGGVLKVSDLKNLITICLAGFD